MSSIPGLPDFSGVDALYAGLILSTCFLGITILQSWNYGNHNRDSWGLRSFVALLVACDVWSTVATAIICILTCPST
ncbi:hypothetical protein CPB84DRAFT_555319 [Gymnopilus junonius]|uniref:Uncharacterized protein n=1 Tax=Gymnopilus junonius TaxID=109634 RepID=A0A9P5TGL0_GYMJU|nr:hypothetical protein CPB84DRAFT_555319 [Gymnopilus junonius]